MYGGGSLQNWYYGSAAAAAAVSSDDNGGGGGGGDEWDRESLFSGYSEGAFSFGGGGGGGGEGGGWNAGNAGAGTGAGAGGGGTWGSFSSGGGRQGYQHQQECRRRLCPSDAGCNTDTDTDTDENDDDENVDTAQAIHRDEDYHYHDPIKKPPLQHQCHSPRSSSKKKNIKDKDKDNKSKINCCLPRPCCSFSTPLLPPLPSATLFGSRSSSCGYSCCRFLFVLLAYGVVGVIFPAVFEMLLFSSPSASSSSPLPSNFGANKVAVGGGSDVPWESIASLALECLATWGFKRTGMGTGTAVLVPNPVVRLGLL